MTNFTKIESSDYLLEELVLLFDNHAVSSKCQLLFLGLLKHHGRQCINKKCKLKRKHMEIFWTLNRKEKLERINSFMKQRLYIMIMSYKKLGSKLKFHLERLILKYITYLMKADFNMIIAFYEMLKILNTFENFSINFKIYIKILYKIVQAKIHEIEKEKNINSNKNKLGSEQLDSTKFFQFNKQKISLEHQLINLLAKKELFWDKFKEGYTGYDEVLHQIYKLVSLIKPFEEKLIKFSKITDNIINFKFVSIFNSVILNNVNVALKAEEEIDNLRKRYFRIDKEKLTPIAFLDSNTIICQTSFLTTECKLLNSSKTEHFAKFFSYSLEELKDIKSINDFMPSILGNKHQSFILSSIDKTTKELASSKDYIESFALNKNGFLFPVKIYFAQSFEYNNDFVMNAAIRKLNLASNMNLLLDEDGSILGVTEDFFNNLKEKLNGLLINEIELLNFFALSPETLPILKENNLTNDKRKNIVVRNQSAILYYPDNMLEILDIMRYKKKLMKKQNESFYYDSSRSNITVKSNKSVKSNKESNKTASSMKFLTTKMNYTDTRKDMIMRLLQNDGYNIKEVYEELIDIKKCKYAKFNYDFEIKMIKFGKRPIDFIKIITFSINRIEDVSIENIKNESFQGSEQINMSHSHISENINLNLKFPEELVPNFRFDFNRGSDIYVSDTVSPTQLEKKEIEFEKNDISDLKNSNIIKYDNRILVSNLTINNPNLNQNINEEIQLKSLSDIKNINNNSNNDNNDNGNESKNASSVMSSVKRSFSIFEYINKLKNSNSKIITKLYMILLLEILAIFLYCVLLYFLSINYVDDHYKPLQEAMKDNAQIVNSISFGTIAIIQYELKYWNLSEFTPLQNKRTNIMLDECLQIGQTLISLEKNLETKFQYQEFLKTDITKFLDVYSKELQQVYSIDLIDYYLMKFHEITSKNYKSPETLSSLARNYIYFEYSMEKSHESCEEEFLNSNSSISSSYIIITFLLIGIVAFFKLSEYVFINIYLRRLVKLINIFLRTTLKETLIEILFLKEIQNILKNPNQYFMAINYPEKVFMKKNLNNAFIEENFSPKKSGVKKNSQQKEYKKERKNFSVSGLRPFSNTKLYAYLIITFSLLISYFLINYFVWYSTSFKMNYLINLNNIFTHMYMNFGYASVYIGLFFRDMAIKEPQYEEINEKYQKIYERQLFYKEKFTSSTEELKMHTQDMPSYILLTLQDINNIDFNQIIQDDICELLLRKGIIDEEMHELCLTEWNGALQKGLIAFLNQFFVIMEDFHDIFKTIDPSVDISGFNENSEKIKKLLKTNFNNYVIMTYVGKNVLWLFFDILDRYYFSVLETNFFYIKIIFWITCGLYIIGFFIIMQSFIMFLNKIYKFCAKSINIIPYEKVIGDEQTIFLIKQFIKN